MSDEILDVVKRVDFSVMELNDAFYFINGLLFVFDSSNEYKSIFNILLERLISDKFSEHEHEDKVLYYMFSSNVLNRENKKKIVELKDIFFEEYCDIIIKGESNEKSLLAIQLEQFFFDDVSDKNYQLQLKKSKDSNNQHCVDYFHEMVQVTERDEAEIPIWIKNYLDKPLMTWEKLLDHYGNSISILNEFRFYGPWNNINSDLVSMQDVFKLGQEDIENGLIMDTEYPINITKEVPNNEKSMIVGFGDEDEEDYDKVQKYMYFCTLYENILEENYDSDDIGDLEDWFTGKCQECGKIIRKRIYSVRIPNINGGWEGCFCSWDCTRNFVKDDNNELEILNLIGKIEAFLIKYGIQDRL